MVLKEVSSSFLNVIKILILSLISNMGEQRNDTDFQIYNNCYVLVYAWEEKYSNL